MSTPELKSLLDRLCAELHSVEAEVEINLEHVQTLRQRTPSATFRNERLDD